MRYSRTSGGRDIPVWMIYDRHMLRPFMRPLVPPALAGLLFATGGLIGCEPSGTGSATQEVDRPGEVVTVAYRVEGMTCEGCAASIERELTKVDGVQECRVTLMPGRAHVTARRATDRRIVLQRIEELGFRAEVIDRQAE